MDSGGDGNVRRLQADGVRNAALIMLRPEFLRRLDQFENGANRPGDAAADAVQFDPSPIVNENEVTFS
jgi:hypothetical protein